MLRGMSSQDVRQVAGGTFPKKIGVENDQYGRISVSGSRPNNSNLLVRGNNGATDTHVSSQFFVFFRFLLVVSSPSSLRVCPLTAGICTFRPLFSHVSSGFSVHLFSSELKFFVVNCQLVS